MQNIFLTNAHYFRGKKRRSSVKPKVVVVMITVINFRIVMVTVKISFPNHY